MIGLTLALGAGLPLGKEGPCVHITCCIVHFMFRLPGFGAIRHSKPRRLQMLAVGCAVGVSSTFGAPIGGVLFSIEVGDPGINLPGLFAEIMTRDCIAGHGDLLPRGPVLAVLLRRRRLCAAAAYHVLVVARRLAGGQTSSSYAMMHHLLPDPPTC